FPTNVIYCTTFVCMLVMSSLLPSIAYASGVTEGNDIISETTSEENADVNDAEVYQLEQSEEIKVVDSEMEPTGPNYILDDFENSDDKWGVSSARANNVNVNVTDEKARFGKKSLKIEYDYSNQPGTSGVYANRTEEVTIPGHPKKISMWVYGDGEGHWLRQMLYDANGQNFNIDYTPSYPNGVTWEGWKYVEAEIPANWTPPFKIGNQAIRYMATSEEAKGKATIYVDNIRAVYEEVEEDTTNPTLTKFTPVDGKVVNENQPTISVQARDDQSGLDFTQTEMKVDGNVVSPIINETDGTISYTPESPLAEGLHNVWVNVADQAGNHNFTNWSFTVETDGPTLQWNVDEETYAGSSFKATIDLKNGQALTGASFILNYNPQKLLLADANTKQEGIQIDVPEKMQQAVTYDVNSEAGTIAVNLNDLTSVSLTELEKILTLTFDLGLDASGDFKLGLTDGQYVYTGGEVEGLPFFIAPYVGHISQPLTLSLKGLSQGTPTIITVTDKNGQPVSDAGISVTGGQKLIKVVEPTHIYKGGSGVAGEPYEEVEVGTLIPVAKTPYGGFDFYRIFMPNGQQRYYHIPKDAVQEVDWGTILGETNEQGIIETENLTLSRIPLKLQAVQGNLVSQVEAITISPQLGKTTPEHVTLTWVDDPKTTQYFTWKTDTLTEGSEVEVVPAGQPDAKPLTFTGTTVLFGDATGEMNLHRVLAKGLKPGTTYSYRVGDGTEHGWSEVQTFTTESAEEDAFRFLFFADTQAYDQKGFAYFTELFTLGLERYPDTQFVLHAGDIVEEGDRLSQWELFKDASQGLADQLPLMMVLGNHDVYGDGANIFKNLYAYPQNGPDGKDNFVYSFDYSNVRFIMLNSEFGVQDMKEQEEWIREEIASAGDKWTIVMFHRSPYKSNPKRGDDATMSVFAPLLEELDVDLVLSGHDHAYMRSHPMKNGEVQPDGKGTQYVIGGSAGPKFYPGSSEDYIDFVFAEDKQVYTAIEIDQKNLVMDTYTIDDELVESFTMTKREKTPAVDKNALQTLIDSLIEQELEEEAYTEATWVSYATAFAKAQAVFLSDDVTQVEVDKAVKDLKTAYEALEEKQAKEQPTVPEDSEQSRDEHEDDSNQDVTIPDTNQQDKDTTLPSTATYMYTTLFFGIILLVVGGIAAVFYRKRYVG
ncbi:metallophosphoesterase, partial [Lentibacillus saliphilus]|uniref:metallophosphoesterase n=1 Tax=Lentibacillus saliphilus TaxID=2737028 RepID=UPI001C300A16